MIVGKIRLSLYQELKVDISKIHLKQILNITNSIKVHSLDHLKEFKRDLETQLLIKDPKLFKKLITLDFTAIMNMKVVTMMIIE